MDITKNGQKELRALPCRARGLPRMGDAPGAGGSVVHAPPGNVIPGRMNGSALGRVRR